MNTSSILLLTLMVSIQPFSRAQAQAYPSTEISNQYVDMKLYLPDSENGYYRATRFEWSGIIYSLEFEGHQYFGEWKKTHDPLFHEDLTGPVEADIDPGPGFDEAEIGGEFIRVGVGALEKTEAEYDWMKTYEIIDHGKWEVDQGEDWIEFRQTLDRKTGWAYVYVKRIELMKDEAGFSIIHSLENMGTKTIKMNQFNHNFFVMDGQTTGPDFQVEFPFDISTENDLKKVAKLEQNKILFAKELSKGSVWMALDGYGDSVEDHEIVVLNRKTGAGVRINGDRPLNRLVFWAVSSTLCPENFIELEAAPGETEHWTSQYRLFTKTK